MIISGESESLGGKTNNNTTNHDDENSFSMFSMVCNQLHDNKVISKRSTTSATITATGPSTSMMVVGLVFVQELLPHIRNNPVEEIQIGTITLASEEIKWSIQQLRQLISEKMIFNLDSNYIFLTNFGTPVLFNQETTIEVKYLITAQNIIKFKRYLPSNRFVIIGLLSTDNGHMLGTVTAAFDTTLKQLRSKVDELIKETPKLATNYHFIHSFFYTIQSDTEANLFVIEIVRNNCVLIKFESPSPFDSSRCIEQDRLISSRRTYSGDEPTTTATAASSEDGKKSTPKRSTSFLSRKVTKQKSILKKQKKQIMISYVRREAAKNAVLLKDSLIQFDLDVYLDVHEIQMGSDWQDSLNNAVQNCDIFVPLITQNYGKTVWTNREVKLADMKNKHIIPINFLDMWPPECLAIQFATTQYIPSRPQVSEHDMVESRIEDFENKDEIWDPESIKQVSKQIVDLIRKISKKEVKIQPSLKSMPSLDLPTVDATNTDKPLIVISAHPEQSHVLNEIRKILTPEYQVWCSIDIETEITASNTNANARQITDNPNLTPIIEENSTLTHPTQDYARKIAENSKQRPKSVPNNESLVDSELKLNLKKKDLVRVMSLNGESSYLSSITPERMERLKVFQEKVLLSSLVIILASEKFYKSRTSEQHVFYCGLRKKTIRIQCDKSQEPVWFYNLMSNDYSLVYDEKSSFFEAKLKHKVHEILDPKVKCVNDQESKIKYLADCMKRNVPNLATCVYVFGTDDLNNPRTVEICQEIGRQLAAVQNINIVTNGFFGSGDLVAHTFVQERRISKNEDDCVIHIVPVKDSKNYRSKCRQNSDNTFEKVTYGQTLFLGESVEERDSVLAQLLDTCILIGGDENEAHKIEEFIWNDHFVIPVKSTGGAAAGEFNVPQKIFSCPIGVREPEWEVLLNANATPQDVSKAVVRVICDLKNSIHEHRTGKKENRSLNRAGKPIKKRTAVRRRLGSFRIDVTQNANTDHSRFPMPSTPDKFLPIVDSNSPGTSSSSSSCSKLSWRSKLNKMFRRFKIHS